MDENAIRKALSVDPNTLKIFEEFGQQNFTRNIDIATSCEARKDFLTAAHFYKASWLINKNSKEVLLAKLLADFKGAQEIDNEELAFLRDIDKGRADYFDLIRSNISGLTVSEVISKLKILGPACESFSTGADPDWMYLRLASQVFDQAEEAPSLNCKIPNRLFMYWDSNTPEAIKDNIQFHQSFARFDVQFYDRERAAAFLRDYFGSDCEMMFTNLRHPSEESDFFRWHAIYAFGGYYVDADDQIISIKAFDETVLSSRSAMFFLSASGPIRAGFFGAVQHHTILEECIRVLYGNCMNNPNLSMWLKTGPGVATRALVRAYHRALFKGDPIPDAVLRGEHAVGGVIREVKVDYRGDNRDWRVFESQL